MTRSELVEVVYQRHGGISRREAQALLDVIFRLIKARLAVGERVDIAGLGSFEVTRTPARVGRHPVTGRPFRTVPGRSLVFRAARALKARLNEVPA